MQFQRCKCGESTVWKAASRRSRATCARSAGLRSPTAPEAIKNRCPHEYEWRFDELTGKRSSVVCQRCHGSYHPDAEDCGGDASRFNDRDLKTVPATA